MDKEAKPQLSAGLMFTVTSFFWCAQYSYSNFVNPELARMGMTAAYMGLVSGAYGLTQTLLRIPLGMAADRLGRQKPFVVIGSLLTAVSSAIFLMFYQPAGFLFARALTGVASASWVSFTVLYSAYFRLSEGPRRISQLNLGNMGGRLAGYLLIILIVPVFGIKSAFTFSLAAGLLAFLASLGLKEAPGARQGLSVRELLNVSKDKYLRACSGIGVLTQVIAFSTYYGFTVNAAKNLGADSAALTWLNIALVVPTLLINFLITSRLLRRFGPRKLVTMGFVVGGLYCLLVPLAGSMWQLFLLQILAGSHSSMSFAVLLGQCVRDIPQNRRGVAMGFYQAVYGIGMTLGPVMMGLMIDWSELKTAFFIVSAFSALSAALSWRLLKAPVGIEKTGAI